LRAGDRTAAWQQLVHAQEIVLELRTSLNMDVWNGADRLAQIYTFLLTELIGANVNADAERVASCRGLVEPLRDAWRDAALAVASASGTATG
jgi:flagellar secretion chaperone FliS